MRLDKFLAAAGRLGSRARAARAITAGKVFLNDREIGRSQSALRLTEGDRVRVWVDRPGSARRRPSSFTTGAIRIVYEDADLLVVDKPAGLLTVPLPDQPDSPSVVSELEHHLRSHRIRRPFVVHRIDRDTSGLVVFARHAAALASLKQQFLRREPERRYLAVVYGRPTPAAGEWRDHLTWDRRALVQKETHARDPHGAEAISRYRVLEAFGDSSLVEVTLVTGKRNQIRLQARLRGHTLVGERRYVYGPGALRPIEFARQALHAARLGFRHPSTDRPVRFDAPLPEDMRLLLEELRRAKVG